MNERIKSLIERAEYQALKQSGSDWEVHVEPSREQIFEKFADLIVRECIQVISNTDTRQSFTTYDLGLVQATMVKIQNNVKKHFKPEE